MSSRAQLWQAGKSFLWKMQLSLVLALLLQPQRVAAQLSANDPLGFFTNLSSRLLQSEFGLGLNQIQVYPTNQYSPAVHRLFQVTANLWETQTNSGTGLPTVFRPRFSVTNDAVYISAYAVVTNDSELAGLPLLDLTASANASSLIPLDGNALVFGVPLVIGARKGLPNFNEYAMESVFQMTRKVELRKSSLGGGDKIHQTNQFFVLSVTVPMAVEFWNSYASNYTRPVNIFVTNRCSFRLTNDLGVNFITTAISGDVFNTNDWPRFNPVQVDSFVVAMRTNIAFLSPVGYLPSSGAAGFVSATNGGIFDTSQELISPRWGLTITNRIQAKIIDQATGQIIDYVLLGAMTSHRNLTEEFSSPITGNGDAFDSLWATNLLASGRLSGRIGIIQQINISRGPNGGVDLSSGGWRDYGVFTPNNVQNAVDAFNRFFQPNSSNLVATVPFFAIVQTAMPMVWQANDPLVHCFSAELINAADSGQLKRISPPGTLSTNTLANIGRTNRRYHPWGKSPGDVDADPDVFNVAIKDPLVRSSDDWNFPTNTTLAIESLGSVHRGTPWQTIYLKSADVGLPTWQSWTGHGSDDDAEHTHPRRDWPLVALIAALLNTNDPRQLLSVNDLNQNNWRATLDGFTVLTNTSTDTQLLLGQPPQFQTLTLSSNSAQIALLVQGIASVRANQPGQAFRSVGDLLATPELSLSSPWLNQNGSYQIIRGITDEAYEKIPAQLLSRVRADSMGSVEQNGAAWQIRFTGYDNYPYAVQCSTNLVNWISVSTNYPTNGVFTFTDASVGVGSKRFYRSVLLP